MNKPRLRAMHKILIVGLVAVIIGVVAIFVVNRPIQSTSQQLAPKIVQDKSEPIVYGMPIRIKIPRLKVDAAIDPVGLTNDRDMEAPQGGRNVGWYKMGSRPGNNGTAVMAGHYGQWDNGEGSVFDNLSDLQKGDILNTEDEYGETASFKVSELRLYERGQIDSTVFNFSSDGRAYLNLITCQGTWDESLASYSDRLVVFAEKVVLPSD